MTCMVVTCLVGFRIRNTENVQDKAVGTSLRPLEQLKPDVVWGILGKVIQSNARFGLADHLQVRLDHVRMSARNGRVKTKGRSLFMSAIKRVSLLSRRLLIVCLMLLLLLWLGWMVTQSTHHIGTVKIWSNLLKISWRLPVLIWHMPKALKNFDSFKSTFRITKLWYLMVWTQIVMFSGNSLSAKILYLLYDRNSGHYNVITKLKGAMERKYICNRCDTLYENIHKCDKVSSLCTPTPLCTKYQTKQCGTCNRRFLSEKCFQNHLILEVKGKLVCQWRQVCLNCSYR